MDLRRVRIFCAVAEHRSFSGAAAALGYTQPSVSHHVSALERELGQQLIVRGARSFTLTTAGEVLLAGAATALADMERTEQALTALARGEGGRLVLGSVVSGLRSVVPPALRAFSDRYPAVDVVLRQHAPAEILGALRGGEVDIGVLFTSSAEAPELAAFCAEPLIEQQMLIALPAAHRYARRGEVALRHLERECWLLPDARRYPGFRQEIDALLAGADVQPRRVIEIADDVAAAKLIAAGVGVGVAPAMTVLPVNGVAYVAVDPPITRTLVLVTPQGVRPPAARALTDELVRAAAALPQPPTAA